MPRLFDPYNEKIIREFMLENPNHPSPFAELICPDPLSDIERIFIHNWARNNQQNGTYNWKHCQSEMRITFNKLHSTNKIKNAWNSEQKRLAREVGNEIGISVQTTTTFISSSSLSINLMNNNNNEVEYFTRTSISSLLTVNDDIILSSPPSPIEPYFRPDLTKNDRNYLLNITFGYWKYH
ncbi:12230_t:CDS:2 [Rhizophagus irregularis]|nr:12230_t:CDS:2 [Rhizophagus irregularis]